ncbi:hypothetical protein ACIBG4_11700 [Nonomuraea sp. NPDC050383]|uniref:hypothetical protein n=1 Tax=Nonomuraea sp. NPDC050383 TaxID=3364362 RepID=UPI00379AEC66
MPAAPGKAGDPRWPAFAAGYGLDPAAPTTGPDRRHAHPEGCAGKICSDPKGFIAGQVRVEPKEYAYQWMSGDDTSDKYRNLWVRIICDPSLVKLADLRKPSFDSGEFAKAEQGKVGGRTVLVKVPNKEFRAFRDVAWVERKGVVVSVTVSQPLFADLGKVVKGIQVK